MPADYIVFPVRKPPSQSPGQPAHSSIHSELDKDLKAKAAQGYEVVTIKFTKTTTESRQHPTPPSTFSSQSTYVEEITEALVVMKRS